ncbi:MAG: trypsin-like serine protease, partial [Solirubrobacterales bacterium]|nr:trypsin-like serine protease [Solirubrobacterales bacterium]
MSDRWRHPRRSGGPVAVLLAVALTASPAAAQLERPPSRIVGGSPAATRAWPAHGELRINGTGLCAGTLVSGRWFLTAAHCATQQPPLTRTDLPPASFQVRMGDSRRSQLSDSYAVDTVIVHEGYPLPEADGEDNDVALLHLNRPAPYRPLGLIAPGEEALWQSGRVATIIGWGSTNDFDGPFPDDLQQAQVPIRPDSSCGVYGSAYNPAVMLCAGDAFRDACVGDSGGPIMVPRARRFALVGITSFGGTEEDPCANPEFPGVYTRIGAPALNGWVRDRIPTAAIAGPDSAPAGPVTFTASATGSPTSFTWDLDEDGTFDDASGTQVSPTLEAGAREV